MTDFDNIEDGELLAKEALKDMLVSEIEIIRDTLSLVNMFFGENMKAVLRLIQETEPNKTNPNE
jgi:hypothetical protein